MYSNNGTKTIETIKKNFKSKQEVGKNFATTRRVQKF